MKNDVDVWFDTYANPHKELVQKIRRFMLTLDNRITECIKWQAPTFVFNGNIASFNPRSKKHVSLMFHTGAKIPGKFDSLQISGDTAAFMTFSDEADFEKKKKDLEAVIRSWVVWKSN